MTEVDEQRLRRGNIRLRQEAHNYLSRWWLGVVVSPGVQLYILSPSRGAEVPREFFGYDAPTGPLQSPGSLVVDR